MVKFKDCGGMQKTVSRAMTVAFGRVSPGDWFSRALGSVNADQF